MACICTMPCGVFWVVIALGYEGDMAVTRGGEIVYMMAVMVGMF